MSTLDTQRVFCTSCGESIVAEARFCPHCGGQQADDDVAVLPAGEVHGAAGSAAAPQPDLTEHVRRGATVASRRLEAVAPGGGEFAGVLLAQLSAPGAVIALLGAAAAAVTAAVIALVLAVLPVGDSSLLVFDHGEVAFVQEVLFQAGLLFGGPFELTGEGTDIAVRMTPMLLTALPVAALAATVRWRTKHLVGMTVAARLLWGAAAGVPLAVVLLVLAVVAKTDYFELTGKMPVTATALFGLLSGCAGGLLGAYLGLRRGGQVDAILPAPAGQVFAVLGAAARALGLAVVTAAVGVTAIVGVQSVRDAGELRGERSAVGATVENSLFAVEHGIHGVALGTLAKFNRTDAGAIGLPIPVTKADRVQRRDGFRITGYDRALPGWLFIVGIVGLIAVPGLLALNAGFGCARAAGARTPLQRLGWGLVPAPVWALGMVALSGLADKTADYPLFGNSNGGSVLGMTLLLVGVLGALGGLLSGQSTRKTATVEP